MAISVAIAGTVTTSVVSVSILTIGFANIYTIQNTCHIGQVFLLKHILDIRQHLSAGIVGTRDKDGHVRKRRNVNRIGYECEGSRINEDEIITITQFVEKLL